MKATAEGNRSEVKAQLDAGADPNLEDAEKITAFIHAKKGGYNEVAELLHKQMKSK